MATTLQEAKQELDNELNAVISRWREKHKEQFKVDLVSWNGVSFWTWVKEEKPDNEELDFEKPADDALFGVPNPFTVWRAEVKPKEVSNERR